jgi:L-malate glycosyltransferase
MASAQGPPLKIVVFAHQLEYGGGLVNAVELAAAMRDHHGHEVIFFASDGPLRELVEAKRLRYVPAPASRFHPALKRMSALRSLVTNERPDLIHVWEYYQCLEAYYFEHLVKRTPLLVTGMMMSVNRVLPKALPTTFGTPELVDLARARGRRHVRLLVPPVDTLTNSPGAADAALFRTRFEVRDHEIAIVSVCRFSSIDDIKAESLFRLVDVAETLGSELPIRLLLVGDGEIRAQLEHRASQVNARLKRQVVQLTGAMIDPCPAYAAADIVVGMGGSSLRGMAFGKPVVIVGARGFSAEFSPETAEQFFYKGMYGVGEGSSDNSLLAQQLRTLCVDSGQRIRLGAFAREFVVNRFSLQAVAADLNLYCREAVGTQPSWITSTVDGVRSAAIWLRERRWSE